MGNADSNADASEDGTKDHQNDDEELLAAVVRTNRSDDVPEDVTLHKDAPLSFQNWNHLMSPPDDDEYRFRYQIARMESMVMFIKAAHTARISLARKAQLGKVNFEVVLGLGGNQKSTIQKQVLGEVSAKEVLASADTPDILSADEYRPFWFHWADGKIKVGAGEKVGSTELLQYEAKRPEEVLVLHVGVQAPKGIAGDFFVTPDTFAATVVARSIKKLADASSSETRAASSTEKSDDGGSSSGDSNGNGNGNDGGSKTTAGDDADAMMAGCDDGETCAPSVAPYLANWFCFKPEACSPYKKHQDILKEKGPVVVGEDGSFSFCDKWASLSVDERNKFMRETEAANAKRMRTLYKAMTSKSAEPVAA